MHSIRDVRISAKTDYALRALFTLVEHWGQGPVSMAELYAMQLASDAAAAYDDD